MKNIIVGTAGHIDHGKTTLIKHLPDVTRTGGKKNREEGSPLTSGLLILI